MSREMLGRIVANRITTCLDWYVGSKDQPIVEPSGDLPSSRLAPVFLEKVHGSGRWREPRMGGGPFDGTRRFNISTLPDARWRGERFAHERFAHQGRTIRPAPRLLDLLFSSGHRGGCWPSGGPLGARGALVARSAPVRGS